MLTFQDEQRVREIIKEETEDIRQTVNKTAIVVDKILKMFVDLKQEHTITKVKVTKLEKRTKKIEKVLKIPSPSESVIFS